MGDTWVIRWGYMGDTLGIHWGYVSDCMILSVLLVTPMQYPVVILWVTYYI